MNLQELLIKLRGEESIPTAAKRIGLSANYYRNIEKGYDPHRGTKSTPSPAGFENDSKYNPEILKKPFIKYLALQKCGMKLCQMKTLKP